ncbi:MAG: response regulator transcription factor [Bacteroidetes bacterium]|nr:response regulator transcription factor [Bacteroidota bacterium]
MRLRAIIIDDEETGIETLKFLLEKYISELKIVAQTTVASEAIELIENYMPEIVFLDISMPEMDGFELLEKLTWKNFNLIFTTAHQEYGLKALKGGAIDYLLKPIDYKDLIIAIDKIKNKAALPKNILAEIDSIPVSSLQQLPANKLAITSKDGVEYIDVTEIISLESQSNYTLIYLTDRKTILTPKTLKDFENQLCNNKQHFIRVHNSYIVNLHKVLRYLKESEDIIMVHEKKFHYQKAGKRFFLNGLSYKNKTFAICNGLFI